jgi:TatD DNase family protein
MSRELYCEDDLTLEDGVLFHSKKGRAVPQPRPLAPLADTHCHLTVLEHHDPARAIARAALAGVRMLVVPIDPTEDGTDAPAFLSQLTSWTERAADLLEACASHGMLPPTFADRPDLVALPDNIHIIAGTHPYGAAIHDDAARERLLAFLDDPRCVGVGEIGLDYTCDVPRDVQMDVFREQLLLAHERDLPVELHIRDVDEASPAAHLAAAALLREVGVPARGCDLHCFTDDVEVARPFIELGCHVAFGGAVTFKRSDDIREAAAYVPTDLILSETDCPYMAPEPLRGQECEPAMVCLSAACVADVREEAGVSTKHETYEALWENACAFVG